MQISSKLDKIQQIQICHRIPHNEYILKYNYVYLRSEGTVFMRKRKKSLASKNRTPVYRSFQNAPSRGYGIFADPLSAVRNNDAHFLLNGSITSLTCA